MDSVECSFLVTGMAKNGRTCAFGEKRRLRKCLFAKVEKWRQRKKAKKYEKGTTTQDAKSGGEKQRILRRRELKARRESRSRLSKCDEQGWKSKAKQSSGKGKRRRRRRKVSPRNHYFLPLSLSLSFSLNPPSPQPPPPQEPQRQQKQQPLPPLPPSPLPPW